MGRPNYPLKMVGARLLVCLAFPVIAAALPAMLAGEEGSAQPKPEAMNSTAPAPDTKQFVDPKDVPKEWVPDMPKDAPKDWPKDVPFTPEAWAKLTPAEFAKYIPGYEEKKKNATEAMGEAGEAKIKGFYDPTKDMATRTDTDGVLMGFDAKTGESKPLVPGVTAPSTGNMSDAAINLAAGENKISTFFDPTKDVGTVNCFDPKTGESKPCLPGGEKKGNASETNLMQTDGQIKQFFDPTADVGKINCIDPTTGKSGPCPGVPKIPGMGGAEKKGNATEVKH